ncbi:hypothetical protein SD70_31550 [Gordoniibacillus kamchatkensis]|uniref:DUF2231 domain-containing protein n=1 Tax=Gordoniibacillus kamchatkensis TaxID=1590651 RepID=A0ABR5A7H3_9BACL|nr:DUF2231 domain-containing protein [Paenibacillus sp. VKM B-2647]KIL36505.1 hypothetical protein SD70_31550 [Paenibacillus sp. VKM B-2647]
MSYLIKNLHFIVIHIPISMLIFSFVFDVLALFAKRREWHAAGLLCLVVGTLGAIAAVATGPEDRNPLVHTHEFYGKMTMVLFIVLTLVRLFFHLRKQRELGGNYVYLAVALIGVLLVGYTGHIGGEMVHPDRSKLRPGQFQERPGVQGERQQGQRQNGGEQGQRQGAGQGQQTQPQGQA